VYRPGERRQSRNGRARGATSQSRSYAREISGRDVLKAEQKASSDKC
jgi:hypothetical protein